MTDNSRRSRQNSGEISGRSSPPGLVRQAAMQLWTSFKPSKPGSPPTWSVAAPRLTT